MMGCAIASAIALVESQETKQIEILTLKSVQGRHMGQALVNTRTANCAPPMLIGIQESTPAKKLILGKESKMPPSPAPTLSRRHS